MNEINPQQVQWDNIDPSKVVWDSGKKYPTTRRWAEGFERGLSTGEASVGQILKQSIPGLNPILSQNLVERPELTAKTMGTAYAGAQYPVSSVLSMLTGKLLSSPQAKEYFGKTQERLAQEPAISLTGVQPSGIAGEVARRATPEQFAGIGKGVGETATFMGTMKLNSAFKRALSGLKQHLPRWMGDTWMEEQAQLGNNVAKTLDDNLSNAYETIYSKKIGNNQIREMSVNEKVVSDILKKSNIDEETGREIAKLKLGKVNTIEKLKTLIGILQKRTSKAYYLAGGTRGKGGVANPIIRRMNTIRTLKDYIKEVIGFWDKDSAKALEELNKLAHDKIYPTLTKMEGVFGKGVIAPTEGVTSTFALRGFGKAAQRGTIRRLPSQAKELGKYISGEYGDDLQKLMQYSQQLVKNMGKYRTRALLTVGAVGTGLYRGGKHAVKYLGGE